MSKILYRGAADNGAASPNRKLERRVFRAHLPETFDPAVICQRRRDYACWAVSSVVVRRFLDKDADETTYVPLASQYVRRHVPSPLAKPLLDGLVSEGVLETDGIYRFSPGMPGRCRRYRIGPVHRSAKIRAVTITHPELLRKMNLYTLAERDRVTNPVHLKLRGWHDRVAILPTAPCGEHPLLDAMIDGERRFSVCAQGRVHTNVTNLPRQYRQYIRLSGLELVSCDVATSQPLLLAVCLAPRSRKAEGGWAIGGRRRMGGIQTALFATCSDSDLSNYRRDCLNGVVYDRIADLTGYDREEVKSLFLAVIYGRPEHMHTKVGEAIRKLYPAVFDAVMAANYRLGHGGLPRLMQRLESQVMIGAVAARFLADHPSTPVLTIHDSILVPAEHVSAAKAMIIHEWKAAFGVKPRVKVTKFTDSYKPLNGPDDRRRTWRCGFRDGPRFQKRLSRRW